MANARKAAKPTTRTTVTKSRKGATTRTTTTKSTYSAGAKSPTVVKRVPTKTVTNTYVTKTSNSGVILGIILILLLLVAIYFLLNPSMINYLSMFVATAPAQQSGQFQSQLSSMNGNIRGLSAFYLNNAPLYNINVSKSWTVQVTDQGTGGATVGQLTASWNGQSHSLSIQNGIINTGYSPTFAVSLSHYDFMSLSEDAITMNTAAAAAFYTGTILTGQLKYTKVN